jgi:hypothetical protein
MKDVAATPVSSHRLMNDISNRGANHRSAIREDRNVLTHVLGFEWLAEPFVEIVRLPTMLFAHSRHHATLH